MTNIIERIFKHRSIRVFEPGRNIPKEDLETIIRAAQRASTSCSGQMYSFIRITGDVKAKISRFCGENIISSASEFIILCADRYRLDCLVETAGGKIKDWKFASLIISSFDVALAAQNAVLAAEELGYGIVFLGTCGDRAEELIEILKLPKGVLPLAGLAIGYPAENPPLRPRLPLEAVLHENEYQIPTEEELAQWINIMGTKLSKEGYYQKYSGKDENYTWKNHLVRKFGGKWLEKIEKKRRQMANKQEFL